MGPIPSRLLLLLLAVLSGHMAEGVLVCQNGGTFDDVRYECTCTPNSYGPLCELTFVTSDPCTSWSSVPVLADPDSAHRLGNSQLCEDRADMRCVDFSVIQPGWHRLTSPAGSSLINRCPTGPSACGSLSPYILADEVPEDNANRILSAARAYRYRPGLSAGCYLPDDTSYPVRILKCSAALTLYYLQPLPSSRAHYCIGDKQPCDAGLTSIDGSGFEPCIGAQCLPRLLASAASPALSLQYHREFNGLYKAEFTCNVFPAFETNGTDGVLHLVEFELTFRNGTSVPIPRCRWEDVSLKAAQNRTFRCSSEFVLSRSSNLYGGTLVCRVQARCSSAGSTFNSIPIVSNSHGFYFQYSFPDGAGVIKPGQAVSLCIDSKNIPVLEEVTFFISVGRQQIMLTDRIDVAVVRRDGNESLECGFKMMNRRYQQKRICQDLTLFNHDPENRVPLGLTMAEQISVVKVNISFKSSADGLFTYFQNGTSFAQRIQNIELKIDLTTLQTDVKTYLHIYTDPYVKPADRAYDNKGTFLLDAPYEGSYHRLIRHKYLPYEMQVKLEKMTSGLAVATEVAIRYAYYIIRIYGSSSTGGIQIPQISVQLPSGVQRNPIALKSDGLPTGVTVENAGHVMRVRLDLYGTILYLWGFKTSSAGCDSFVVSKSNLFLGNACRGTPTHIGSRIVLDLSLVPGFYDTSDLVEGLVYGDERQPITDARENLFSEQYQMKPMRTTGRMQPTEVLSICECNDEKMMTSNCFVNLGNIRRERREAASFQPPIQPSPTQPSSPQPRLFIRPISSQEADEFCDKFVQLQLSKSVSTDICSAIKDPTGQTDYISQFRLICAQYAATLGTFDFSQSLFNSMLGMCYTDMTFNATVVLGNATQIEALVRDLCPANCSGRGSCISGECSCISGYWGVSCEFETAQRDQMPVEIQLLQRDISCSSADCPAAYLSVRPLLRPGDCVCSFILNSSINFTEPSVFISGDIVKCDLRSQHRWLAAQEMIFADLQITVTAADWEANNTVRMLLHQSRCSGQPVTCDGQSMTCRAGPGGRQRGRRATDGHVIDYVDDDVINRCLPASGQPSAAALPLWTLAMGAVATALAVVKCGCT